MSWAFRHAIGFFCVLLSPVGSLFLTDAQCHAQKAKVISSRFVYEKAPFPSCHASTIVEAADGTMVSAWFGGKYEKSDDVGIWLSRLVAGEWTVPVEVANGIQFQWQGDSKSGQGDDKSVSRVPTWNPVLFQPSQGPLMLFYKAGPSPQTWWGMLTTSVDGGVTWDTPTRLPEGIFGPIKNKPMELADGTLLCPTSYETPGDDDSWTVHFEHTADLGKTWTRTKSLNDPLKFGAIQPSLLSLGNDRLLAIGRSRQGYLFQLESPDLGKTWGEMSLTSVPNPNSGADAVTLKDGRHLLIYNHVTKSSAEWGGKRSPLNLAISTDGRDWKPLLELENEPKEEFSYPAIIQTKDGRVHITYTWKRLKIKHAVLELE